MAGGRGARSRTRGGDRIQALRRIRARLTLALCALAAYAGVATYAATRELVIAAVVLPVSAVGGILLLFVLARGHDDLLGWALGLGGAAYGIATIAHGTHVDEAAPLVGLGLLLSGELSTWSLDERLRVPAERSVAALRLAAVAGLGVVSLAVSSLVIVLSLASVGDGLVWTALGAAAAVGVVALVLRLR